MGGLNSTEQGVYYGVGIGWSVLAIITAYKRGWFEAVKVNGSESHLPGIGKFLALWFIPLLIGLGLFALLYHKPRVDRTNELIKLINDNKNKFVALVNGADAYSIVPLKVAEDAVAELKLTAGPLADLIQAVKDDKQTDENYIKLLNALNDKYALGKVIPTSTAGDTPGEPKFGYAGGMQW